VTAANGIKRLGLAVVAAFVAGALALALVSMLVSADSARDAVKAEIKAITGLDPVLRGPVSVGFFPTAVVEFHDVALSAGDPSTPVLTAGRLAARLRALPLLAGRIEISDIELEQPQILLDIDADGSSNWTSSLDALAHALAGQAHRSGRGPSFSQIYVSNGTMLVRDGIHDVTETLSVMDLSLTLPASSRGLGATGSFRWRGEPVDVNVGFGDLIATLGGTVSSLKVRLTGAPMKIAFDGTVSSRPTVQVEGTLAIDAPSLRTAMEWTGNRPPPGGGFGRFNLKAKTNVNSTNIALSGVNLELDGNFAEGVLSYASTGRRTWQGTLAVDALDLTPYVSTARLVAANSRDWDRMPIVLDGLAGFDLDLRLSAAKVAIGDARLGRTAIAANLRAGRLAITIGESQAYKGVITGSLALAKAPEGAAFKAQILFNDVDLDTCLAQLFGIRRVEGKGQLSLALEGNGHSVMAMTRTLEGNAKIIGTQGTLSGINIEQVLRRLERRPLSGSGDWRSGRTPYDRLSVLLAVRSGIVSVEDVSVEGPTVRVALVGTASVPARDLDLKGTASLVSVPSEGAAVFELPFVVQGSWDDPAMLLDAQSLIRRSGATAPLLDAVRNRKTRDAVRAAIEKLSGAPSTPPPTDAPGAAMPSTSEQ
jgi:AsmA protein